MSPTAQALARTYSDRGYSDPWEKVLDYRRVREYAAEHPAHGRTRVGNALDLPPSRVRGWLKDGMPDPVRGIQTAIDHGWLDPDPAGETAAALVDLLAHVLAGGSIKTQTYVPSVTVGRRLETDDVRAVFDRVGVETVVRRADDDGRATEVLPERDGSVLGRCLVAMGAPAGEKGASTPSRRSRGTYRSRHERRSSGSISTTERRSSPVSGRWSSKRIDRRRIWRGFATSWRPSPAAR